MTENVQYQDTQQTQATDDIGTVGYASSNEPVYFSADDIQEYVRLNKDKTLNSLDQLYEKLDKFVGKYKLPDDWMDILQNDGFVALLKQVEGSTNETLLDSFNEELSNIINSTIFSSPLMFVLGSAKDVISLAYNLSSVKKSEKQQKSELKEWYDQTRDQMEQGEIFFKNGWIGYLD